MLISLTEYAAKHGKNESSARRMALRGRFATAQKIGRNWMIEAKEPWPDYRTSEYKEGEKSVNEFAYNSEGKLIVDGIFVDLRYGSSYIAQIGENYYMFPSAPMMKSAEAFAKSLRPIPNYSRPEYFEPTVPELSMMVYHCAYRNLPERLGRAITQEELAAFTDENNVTAKSDVTEAYKLRFVDGEPVKIPYTVQYFQVPTEDCIDIEMQLKSKGIEVFANQIGVVQIRVN